MATQHRGGQIDASDLFTTLPGGSVQFTRRGLFVLAGTGLAAGAAAIATPSSAAATSSNGLIATTHATHVHGITCTCEGIGTGVGAAEAAIDTGVRYIWDTKHNWHLDARTKVQATSLGNWNQTNPAIAWKPDAVGTAISSTSTIVSLTGSDAMYGTAATRFAIDTSGLAPAAHVLQCTNTKDVLTGSIGEYDNGTKKLKGRGVGPVYKLQILRGSACVQIVVTLSRWRNITGTTKANRVSGDGRLRIVFRIGGSITTQRAWVSPTNPYADGNVDLPALAGSDGWALPMITIVDWVKQLWPEYLPDGSRPANAIIADMNSITGIDIGLCVWDNGSANLLMSRLDLPRYVLGADAYALNEQLVAKLNSMYSSKGVLILPGNEISDDGTHIGGLGGSFYGVSNLTPPGSSVSGSVLAARAIRAAGGVPSYNHAFGTTSHGRTPQAVFDAARRTRANECVFLETGYDQRGGQGMPAHIAVGDRLACIGIDTTDGGVNDSHTGINWKDSNPSGDPSTGQDTMSNLLFSSDTTTESFLLAMKRGEVSPVRLGSLDKDPWIRITLDEYPQGSIVYNPAAVNVLIGMTVIGVPAGSIVYLDRGKIDFKNITSQNIELGWKQITISAFGTAEMTMTVPGNDYWYRIRVCNAAGKVTAYTTRVKSEITGRPANLQAPAERYITV